MNHSQRIALIGGTGRVGKYVAIKAMEKGYQVRMLVRNPSKYTLTGIDVIKGDVQDRIAIQQLIQECDVVINAFGQPMKAHPIYSTVTQSILEVMTEYNIRRYIGVTGGSLSLNSDKKSMVNRFGSTVFELLFSRMMNDKKKEWMVLLLNKHIDWTMVRLPFVLDKDEKQLIKEHLTDMPGSTIRNGDIATFLLQQIDNDSYVHKAPFISN